jgi:hypothetical protein
MKGGFMWCWDGTWGTWGWWWLVPLIGMALCIFMCIRMRSRMPGGRFCCWGGYGSADLDDMKREIRELREEIGSGKKSEEKKNGR